MTIEELKNQWRDTPEQHKYIHELFVNLVNLNRGLNDHRTYVESRVFGMGERSFWWLWKLILAELPEQPKLLEIGVFKAGTMSLWKLLREDAQCFGVTPLDGRGTGWTEDDYEAHIKKIHDDFGLAYPTLFIGGSEEMEMINAAFDESPYDVCYVDGDHTHLGALGDLNSYAPMVKPGGWLVVDDAACKMSMEFGYFQGIDTVCSALEEWLQSDIGKEFYFQFNVVHLMCYKRK